MDEREFYDEGYERGRADGDRAVYSWRSGYEDGWYDSFDESDDDEED